MKSYLTKTVNMTANCMSLFFLTKNGQSRSCPPAANGRRRLSSPLLPATEDVPVALGAHGAASGAPPRDLHLQFVVQVCPPRLFLFALRRPVLKLPGIHDIDRRHLFRAVCCAVRACGGAQIVSPGDVTSGRRNLSTMRGGGKRHRQGTRTGRTRLEK